MNYEWYINIICREYNLNSWNLYSVSKEKITFLSTLDDGQSNIDPHFLFKRLYNRKYTPFCVFSLGTKYKPKDPNYAYY